MKYLALIILLIHTVGCSQDKYEKKELVGKGIFNQGEKHWEFGEGSVIEASTVLVGSKIYSFLDKHYDGGFDLKISEDNGETWEDSAEAASISYARFPFTLEEGGVFYTVGKTSQGIMLWSSADGVQWQLRNGGRPILAEKEASSIWCQVWNVALVVDQGGVAHIFAETSDSTPGQAAVGLAHSSAPWDPDNLDFEPNQTETHILVGAGNAYATQDTDGNTLLIYGAVNRNDLFFENYWFLTAATAPSGADLSDPNVWTEHQTKLHLGSMGAHVADPHLVNLPEGGSLLTFSIDQKYSVGLKSDKNIDEVTNYLRN